MNPPSPRPGVVQTGPSHYLGRLALWRPQARADARFEHHRDHHAHGAHRQPGVDRRRASRARRRPRQLTNDIAVPSYCLRRGRHTATFAPPVLVAAAPAAVARILCSTSPSSSLARDDARLDHAGKHLPPATPPCPAPPLARALGPPRAPVIALPALGRSSSSAEAAFCVGPVLLQLRDDVCGRWARRPSGLATPSCAVPRRRAASRAAASSSPRASSRKASASAPRGRGRRCSVVSSHDAVWWCVCFVVWHACSILRCFAQRVTYSICERRKRLSNPRGEPFIICA